MITAQTVKELRERTGAGMMDCKKALNDTNGDIEKAIEVLREKGLAAAAKKAGRVASEGIVETYISEDKKNGAIVEVNCETDFVSIGEDFKGFVKNAALQASKTTSNNIDEFTNEKFVGAQNLTVKDAITALIAKLGENMSVRRFTRFSIDKGVVQSYTHGGGRIGVLVELACENNNEEVMNVAKDVAMQIAAANPLFLSKNDVDNEALDKEREIYRVQALNEGKPEKIVDKMVDGRIQKYYKEVCLLEQVWVRDGDYTISKYLEKKSKEIGCPITVTRFIRYEKGEGLEKKDENFAEEVQRQMNQSK